MPDWYEVISVSLLMPSRNEFLRQRFSVSIRCFLEQDVKQSNWLMPAANKRGNSLVDETSTCIFETRELEYRRDYLRMKKKSTSIYGFRCVAVIAIHGLLAILTFVQRYVWNNYFQTRIQV